MSTPVLDVYDLRNASWYPPYTDIKTNIIVIKIIVENKSILYGFIFSNFIFCIVCKVKNGKTTIINNIPINVNSNKLEGLLSKNKYPKIGVNT